MQYMTSLITQNEYKIFLVGVDGVGRKSLLRKVRTNEFDENHKNNVRANVKINGESCTFEVIDKGGFLPVERYPAFVKVFDCIVFIYAVTSRSSLEEVGSFLSELKHIDENAPRILIGNKKDLSEEREVSYEEGKEMAAKLECREFYEVSAKEDTQEEMNSIFKSFLILSEKQKSNVVSSITGIFSSGDKEAPTKQSCIIC